MVFPTETIVKGQRTGKFEIILSEKCVVLRVGVGGWILNRRDRSEIGIALQKPLLRVESGGRTVVGIVTESIIGKDSREKTA